MKKYLRPFLAALGATALLSGMVYAAQNPLPSTIALVGGGDYVQDIPNGNPVQTTNQYATVNQLAGYVGSLPTPQNVLIGGDATTNLFQRATTGASQTTTVAYGGPDRWAYWSGTSTAMTVSRDSTAGDLPAGYQYAFKMARTSGQTGVVQVCMAQEVESANSFQFQGTTAEVDFHAVAGTNFSAASSQVQVYVVAGTSADEGMSKLAFTINGGGGGGSGWTNGTLETSALVTIGTTAGRYAVIASIPAAISASAVNEIGVAICFTPVGTAGTNDYVALSGIQMVRNPTLSAKASTSVGYSCDNQLNTPQVNCTSFDRWRNATQEALLQYRYYYQINETNGGYFAAGMCSATNVEKAVIPLPVTMRAIPTLPSPTTGGFKWNLAGTLTAAGTFTLVTGSTASIATLGDTTTCTAGNTAFLNGSATTGILPFSAEL